MTDDEQDRSIDDERSRDLTRRNFVALSVAKAASSSGSWSTCTSPSRPLMRLRSRSRSDFKILSNGSCLRLRFLVTVGMGMW